MNQFKLFKINVLVENALNNAINDEGEIVDESALVLWENGIAEKNTILLDFAAEIKNLEAEEIALAETIKNLQARKSGVVKKIERIKSILSSNLPKGSKLSDGRVKISWRKSSSVQILGSAPDPKEAPEKLVKISYEFSKTAIKEALEQGEKITWATISENENIQIK